MSNINISMENFDALSQEEKTQLLAQLLQENAKLKAKAEPKPKTPYVAHAVPKGDRGTPGMKVFIPSPGGFPVGIKLNKATSEQPLTAEEKAWLKATGEALVKLAE